MDHEKILNYFPGRVETLTIGFLERWIKSERSSGVRVPDGHFIRIPHGAELRRRSFGSRTPLYNVEI